GLGVQPGGLHQLAVGVELELVDGAVADADRRRVAVAGEEQLLLLYTGAAVESVEHVEARLGELSGMHQPPEVGVRFCGAAELEEGVDGEGAVADPGVAVVPVALAA